MKYVGSKKNKQDIATIEDVDNVQDQIDGKVNKSGDTMTGTLTVGSASLQTNGYVTGTWLKTTANIALGSTPSKIAVINNERIYSRTPAQIKSDIGLSDVDNVKQYSASNPPPYPVTSVNGKTGAVTVELPDNLVKYQEIVDVEATPNVNADTLSGHSADYFATATSVSTLNNTVSTLSTSVDTNAGDIAALDADMSTAKTDISNLKSADTTLQSNIDKKLGLSGGTMTGTINLDNMGYIVPNFNTDIRGNYVAGTLLAESTDFNTGIFISSALGGNITMKSASQVDVNAPLWVRGNTNYEEAQVRNIIISTEDPSGGSPGEIWIKYST